jgi:tRNA(Ile2) C34 agmatinyltransferase TiaS
MNIYMGFDDTDVAGAKIGTGRLVRLFERKLPEGAQLWGALRHQLLVDPRIPFTSHNSPACAVVEIDDEVLIGELVARAVAHVSELASDGADPGLCVARETDDLSRIIEFGLSCTQEIETQDHAREIAARAGAELLGLGGTNDGIIGALASVGLTAYGWSGRFLEYGKLRRLPDPITVAALAEAGIAAVSIEKDARTLEAEALIHTGGWLSPRLWGGRAVAPVEAKDGRLIALGKRPRDAEIAD